MRSVYHLGEMALLYLKTPNSYISLLSLIIYNQYKLYVCEDQGAHKYYRFQYHLSFVILSLFMNFNVCLYVFNYGTNKFEMNLN